MNIDRKRSDPLMFYDLVNSNILKSNQIKYFFYLAKKLVNDGSIDAIQSLSRHYDALKRDWNFKCVEIEELLNLDYVSPCQLNNGKKRELEQKVVNLMQTYIDQKKEI